MTSLNNILDTVCKTHTLSKDDILTLLNSDGKELYKSADNVRKKYVGDGVHLRGLIEFSSICKCACKYCGLRSPNTLAERYRLEPDEIITYAKSGAQMGYKTIVLQSGEDSYFDSEKLCYVISEIKKLDLALTLSIGERTREEYKAFKSAGADRYLLRIETTDKKLYEKMHPKMDFENRKQCLYDLKELGIDILTTANNHCMDTGYSGLESTLNFLDDAEIEHTGTNRSTEEQNKILIKEVNGIKIAFLSFTYGTNGIGIPSDKSYAVNLIDEEFILSQIELAKKESPDLICASMHWGIEYQNPQNENQEKWADFLIENGVSIIFGSHPHVLQPMEYREVGLENGEIRKGFVIYSLGNFMSGQTQKNTRTSIILNLDITKKGGTSEIFVDNVSYIPIYTYKGTGAKKYKIVNIDKAIKNYENETDRAMGQSNYILFKEEVARLRKLLEI